MKPQLTTEALRTEAAHLPGVHGMKPPRVLEAAVETAMADNPKKRKRKETPSLGSGPLPAKNWSLSIDRVFAQDRLRFDASFFDPVVDAHVESLEGYRTDRLSELAKLILPGRFERVWAVDEEQGRPYLNATDLLTLFSLGVPSQVRYLSPESDTNFDALRIREGWLLMTCSGTIGRVYHVPARLDGWAATHDLIRIIPNSPDTTGCLYAWCMTEVAQAQILSHTHGGQVNHVTDQQVGELLVPRLHGRTAKKLNERVMAALADRERALNKLVNAWPTK